MRLLMFVSIVVRLWLSFFSCRKDYSLCGSCLICLIWSRSDIDLGTFLQFFRNYRLLYKAPVSGLEKEVAFLGLLPSKIPGKKFIKIIYL